MFSRIKTNLLESLIGGIEGAMLTRASLDLAGTGGKLLHHLCVKGGDGERCRGGEIPSGPQAVVQTRAQGRQDLEGEGGNRDHKYTVFIGGNF